MIFDPDVGGLEAVPAANEEDATLKVIETAMIEALNLGNALEVLRLKRLDAREAPECAGVWHNTAAAHGMLRQYASPSSRSTRDYACPTTIWSGACWTLISNRCGTTSLTAQCPSSAHACAAGGVFLNSPHASNGERGLRPVCWHTAHLLLPDKVTRWMIRDRWTIFELMPSAPVSVRRRLEAWLNNRRNRMLRV